MGNLSFMYPTENEEEFNLDTVEKIISDLGYKTKRFIEGKQLVVSDESTGDIIVEFWMQDNYLISPEDNRPYCDLPIKNWLCYNHSPFEYREIRRTIQMNLHDRFSTFILDEGIHPDYIGPEYSWS